MYHNIHNFFIEELEKLDCQATTRAYITSVLCKYTHNNETNFCQKSVTLVFANAKYKMDFVTFQNLADYVFFCEVVFPQFLRQASKEYYHTVAKLSYYSCYRLINKQMDVYENLADQFTDLTNQTKSIIRNIEKGNHIFEFYPFSHGHKS